MLKIQLKHPFEASHWLVEKNFTIGSAPENNLVLNDPSVSPVHAKITNQRGAFLLSDCDSKYGSFLNEEKISQVQIGRYDVIRIGNIDIEVVDPLRERENSAYQWSLVSTNGTMTGQEFRIRPQKENKIKIGRGRQCDISFPGTQLAKEHVELNIKEESIELIDLDSATGTFVNNERIKQATLKAGDMLRLDIHNFRIFGPGYEMPRSATVSPPPKSEEAARRPRPATVETPIENSNSEEPEEKDLSASLDEVDEGIAIAIESEFEKKNKQTGPKTTSIVAGVFAVLIVIGIVFYLSSKGLI